MGIMLNKVMSFISKNSDLDNDKAEIIRYGLEIVIAKAIFSIMVIIIGLIMHCFFESLIFAVSLSLLRKYGGGYHATTRRKCFILSNLTLIVSLILIKLAENYQVMILPVWSAALISVIYALVFAPIDTPNKQFDKDEFRLYGKRSKIITVTLMIISVLFWLLNIDVVSLTILMAITAESYLMLKGKITNYINREKT